MQNVEQITIITKQLRTVLWLAVIFSGLNSSLSAASMNSGELTISYIHRTPEIDYVYDSSNPAIEGWPAVGQSITWQALVKNWDDNMASNVTYAWYLDGLLVDLATISIDANSELIIPYNTTWSFDRKELTFEIDVNNVIPEEEEDNNSLTVYTDAITAGFWVEQGVYDYFRQHQSSLNTNSVCWEDWAHRHISMWNDMFANATYPHSPDGVLDRIRLDKIVVVPDGSLPLAGGIPSNNPDRNDRSVDLMWGFPSTLITSGFYNDIISNTTNNPFYFEGSLLHELGHARYLIDLYGYNIDAGVPGERVMIKENGQYILGTDYMPFIRFDVPYYIPIEGLMNGQYTSIDEPSVLALNQIAGHRATVGNQNAPSNIGEFMHDIPAQNQLKILDQNGDAIKLATFEIYQADPLNGVWYGASFDDTPDVVQSTDANGNVLLQNDPFNNDGIVNHFYGWSNGTAIIRLEKGSKVGYGFISRPYFFMEYMKGNTNFASYEIVVNMINETCVDEDLIDPNAVCPTVFDPVCGCNGMTYSNSCFAVNIGGVTSWLQGECDGRLNCLDVNLQSSNVLSGVYSSAVITSSDGLVNPPEIVLLESENEVVMEPGFHTMLGAELLAQIDPCRSVDFIIGEMSNGMNISETFYLHYGGPCYFWFRGNASLCPNHAVEIDIIINGASTYSNIVEVADLNLMQLPGFTENFSTSAMTTITINANLIQTAQQPNQDVACSVLGDASFGFAW